MAVNNINITYVKTLLKEKYTLEGELTPLVGCEDINFRLNCTNGKKFVVKFSNIALQDLLDFQNEVLNVINQSISITVFPTFLPGLDGSKLVRVQVENHNYILRVLPWLDGELLSASTRSEVLYFNLGSILGELDKTLYDSAIWYKRKQDYKWDLQFALLSTINLDLIKNHSDRRIATYFLQQFEYFVHPQLPNLRKGVIHSDANDNNILVNGDKISGLIDFGDAVYSPVINELAIAISYCMMDEEDLINSAIAIVRGFHSKFPLEEIELDLLYYLIATRLAVGVCQAAYSEKNYPGDKYLLISQKPAWNLLYRWVELNPIYFTNSIKDALGLPKSNDSFAHFKNVREKYINPSLRVSYHTPIKMEKAAFQYMYSADGTTYLDCVNNICHVGHAHPAIVAAAVKQIAILNTNTRYYYDALNSYAEKLASKFPDPLEVVFFLNSGSEAGDLAQRIARTVTGDKTTVVVEHAYHGNTLAGIEASPYKHEGKGGLGKVDHIHCLDIPDGFRGAFKYDNPDAGILYAKQIDEVLIKSPRIAAFYCESIIGCGGQVTLPEGYLKYIYEKTRNAGGLCIADEVQVGFGRVGVSFWGFQLQNVIPDIVVIGKPMGNGHPLAAVVTTREIADAFNNGMEYFSSFGGNPVSCAIGEAVLDVIESEGLQENALDTGSYFKDELNQLARKYSLIGDVRGYGLFLGVEMVEDPEALKPATIKANQIVESMKDAGILLSADGPFNNVIKIKPPMTFSKSNVDRVINQLDITIKSIK